MAGPARLLLLAGTSRRAIELLARAGGSIAPASADSDLLRDPDGAEGLRRACPGSYLPVLVYGRMLDDSRRAALLAGGADDAVGSDRPSAELAERIRLLLHHRAARDELARCKLEFRTQVARQLQLVRRIRRRNHQLREMAFTDPLSASF